MNYAYLSLKYLGVECLMEDRTYDGLMWPKDHGEKPSEEIFAAFQREEDRQARAEGKVVSDRGSELALKQHQARAKAAQDLIPYESVIKAKVDVAYQEALEARKLAIDIQAAQRLKAVVDEEWREITEAQGRINDEAHRYLDETAHHVEREQHGICDVPDEIALKRKLAIERISDGTKVYAKWQELRSKEMPSRQELHDAIVAGGVELERMKKICRDVQLKYPRPKRI